MSEVTASRTQREVSPQGAPKLLCELEPRHRVFLRNLGDLLLRREPPPVVITAKPVRLRKDYFIRTGVPPVRFLESYASHIAFVVLIYLLSLPFFHSGPQLESPLQDTKITYYPVSDYLPPINTAPKVAIKARHGAPKLAKQEILSVPPEPDNKHQTIVTPPKVKLDHDVSLPNIVAWTPVPARQPVAASARTVSQLKVPQFEPQVVGPIADISHVKEKLELPTLPQPSVVAPPVSADKLKLQHGQINMADLQPQVAAPKLPTPAQRANGIGEKAAKNIPPAPNVQNLPAAQGQGQLIALGLTPADVHGPITMPSGNRSGEFHASPTGKPDAPGTPNIAGTGTSDNGGGRGAGKGLPPGIMVGAPPLGATTSAVAGTPNPAGTVAKAAPAANTDLAARKRMIATAMKPSLPTINERVATPPPATLSDDPDLSIEQRVFGRKRYYSLVMNMPNLNSATGSWIIRFAELKQTDDKGTLTAPVVMTKVDPAYPPDVLRDHVEGTVTLYAIIRSDGTVGSIRVLDSLDDRLDQNAVHAFAGWHFRPGTKNGEPVALEAVIQIPFRMKHLQ